MKLTILQKNLHQGLNTVGHIATKNANMPILNNVLISIKDGLINLSATNLEIAITKQIRGKADKDGEITVDAKILSDYIALLPNEKIDISLDKQELKINCQQYNTVIKGQEAQDFPVIPQVDKKIGFNLSVASLKNALSQILFAINPGDNRLELTGVLFDIKNKTMNLVATDSFRLAKTELDFSLNLGQISADGLKVIIPFKTMQEISRIINSTTDELSGDADQLKLFLSDNQAMFVYQGTTIISRLIEGHYPDYEQVMPINFKTEAVIDRGELSRAIKMASIFSTNITNAIDITINSLEQKIIIEAVGGQAGSQQADLPAKIDGQNNNVRLNYRYLLECLNVLSAGQVIIKLIDDVAACQISVPKDDNYQYIIVPLRK
ncbi:MAG TPA: DNA polymerase III subunit beta [bacterium]|jgi:DNA polymerase-3 subunit beta|nr:DNA polymerase III subunit beta [bacterium]HOF79599.1 DNA polymerase III subunit beta [bacterium]HOQ91428.1 DNA polymerase III subunit beta [bacterium]HPL22265.1 DNA polymerase III subunit beta [bacterium]HQA84167.1 DNA polymerase III subunit beta [bacterium]